MHYTRIYSDDAGESHFEQVNISLTDKGTVGRLSLPRDVDQLVFRENEAGYDWDFHNAPARQFIILLDGIIEITTSLGEIMQFKAGDILLVEDTEGKGHKTRNITNAVRHSLFITL